MKFFIKQDRILLFVLTISLLFAFLNIKIAFATEQEQTDGEQDAIITTFRGKECVAGEVLVKFSNNQSPHAMQNTLNILESTIQEELPTNSQVVTSVPEGVSIESFIEELETQPNVDYAQPNFFYRLDKTVDDPLAQILDPDQWHLDTIDVYEAWDTTMGSSDVIVAVLDTGVDLDHPDLDGQVFMHTDTVDEDNNANDDNGHGTHVCGIIAASTNNGIGVAGIAPKAKLIVADVFGWYHIEVNPGIYDDVFGAMTSEIIEGIDFAVENGADVINMSLGGYGCDPDTYPMDELYLAAIDDAVTSGVVVVAAAGNDGLDEYDEESGESTKHYPSDFESCISVIWTNEDDTRNANSNYGPSKDISAPGNVILSTYWKDDDPSWEYAYLSGTSMAAPIVTGVVALMLSVNPNLTVAEVKEILYNTAVDLGVPGKDDEYGYGRVDAQAAVLAAVAAGEAHVNGVTLNESVIDIMVGEQDTLTETVDPDNATNKNVTWSSAEESIATVTDGVVEGVALGSTTITVTTEDGGYTDTCTVNVVISVSGVTLDKSSIDLCVGETDALTESITPSNATNKNVLWSSSNENVVTVEGGSVSAVLSGTAIITVTTVDGEFTDSCIVTVKSEMIESAIYDIDRQNNYLRGIELGSSVSVLKANLTYELGNIIVCDKYGYEYDGYLACTGMSVKLVIDGTVKDELVFVILGDASGDGEISIADYTLARLDILALKALEDEHKEASDINGDGKISITDYTLMRLDILGIKSIH